MAKCKQCPYKRVCRDECYGEQPCSFAIAFDRLSEKVRRAKTIAKNKQLNEPICRMTLPSGIVIQAQAHQDDPYPCINIDLVGADSSLTRLCFVEHNPEREPGKELCIGAYCSSEEDTVYYDSYYKYMEEQK